MVLCSGVSLISRRSRTTPECDWGLRGHHREDALWIWEFPSRAGDIPGPEVENCGGAGEGEFLFWHGAN